MTSPYCDTFIVACIKEMTRVLISNEWKIATLLNVISSRKVLKDLVDKQNIPAEVNTIELWGRLNINPKTS